jgi:hypothetical protein
MEEPPPQSHAHSIYMLRTVQQQHLTLSMMADQKANMLLGVSSVVMALVVREGRLDGLSPAVLVMGFFSFAAALLCMLSVIPKIGGPKPDTRPEARPNILFFGIFAELPEEEFLARMRKVMSSDAEIYATMVRDVHQQGLLLKRKKYFWLGWAYRVFIVGLVLTCLTFLLQLLF